MLCRRDCFQKESDTMKRKKNQKIILLSDPAERRTAAELSAYLLAQSVLALVMLHLFQRAIDALQAKEETLLCYLLLELLVCLVYLGFSYIRERRKKALYYAILKKRRKRAVMFLKCLASPMDAGIDESERLQILGESLPKLCGFATETLPELVGAVFQIALFYAYGVQINIWITSALLLAAALVVFYQYRQIEKSSENYEEGERLEAEFAGFTRSAVSNHEIVQAALDIDKLGESAISKMGARNKS